MDKSPIELALLSPDPSIRAIALRRKALDDEMARLDATIRTYADIKAAETQGLSPFNRSVALPPSPRSTGDFIAMVRATLKEANRPLTLDELYRGFWARLPEQQPTLKDSFRLRLSEHRDKIIRLSQQKGHLCYWMAEWSVPSSYSRDISDAA